MQSSYIVEARSRYELRQYARQIRRSLGLENQLYFPVINFLEVMPEFFPEFYFEVVEDHELPFNVHADIDVLNHCMRIKNSVYEGAYDNIGRDRMTIAHEIGHYLTLCVSGFKLQRNFGNQKLRPFEDPEWQAKCFAGELLIPAHLISSMDIFTISNKCGVSVDAARIQKSSLEKRR